jgi:ABC-type antimicrobial peptide transport system permease subunit
MPVAQRTREIGIRMTLGAEQRDVARMVLRQSMRPVAIGVAIGLAGSAAVSQLLSSLLFGVSPPQRCSGAWPRSLERSRW